jgi:hypothetical protein
MEQMPRFAPGRLGVAAVKAAAVKYTGEDMVADADLAAQVHADVVATMEANPGMSYSAALEAVNGKVS